MYQDSCFMKYIALNAIINIGSKHFTENLTVSECNMPVGCTSNSATPIFWYSSFIFVF
jgi:hypothetical protein